MKMRIKVELNLLMSPQQGLSKPLNTASNTCVEGTAGVNKTQIKNVRSLS